MAQLCEQVTGATVVIASYNRAKGLRALLADLARQTDLDDGREGAFSAFTAFDVMVVDDGSKLPVRDAIDAGEYPFDLEVITQANSGPAVARDRGIRQSLRDVVVILDDDMRVQPDFVARHLNAHRGGARVVLGHILPSPVLQDMPVFERFHAHQLAEFVRKMRDGQRVRGVHLCTGNVSMRREDYLAVGGFDAQLPRSEDRELGVRLEKLGARFVFCEGATSSHQSDHDSLPTWMARAFNYGVSDQQICSKHPETEDADPWRFWFLVNPVSRALVLLPVLSPRLGMLLSRATMAAALQLDRRGYERGAVAGTTLTYGLEYFRGMRVQSGSLSAALRAFTRYLPKRLRLQQRSPEAGLQKLASGDAGAADGALVAAPEGRDDTAIGRFVAAVSGDHNSVKRYRAKYHAEGGGARRLPADLVRKVGFQMMTAIRVMHLCRDSGHMLAAQLVSRLIRHVYGAEIHWDAQLAPGMSVVHGNGLVISHAATVHRGCILFQNVTLGEGIHPVTRQVGGPVLEADVHVGPGATILGPVVIGAGSKIMAGAVVTESVPPRSVVRPAPSVAAPRARQSAPPVRRGRAQDGADVVAMGRAAGSRDLPVRERVEQTSQEDVAALAS